MSTNLSHLIHVSACSDLKHHIWFDKFDWILQHRDTFCQRAI